MTIGERIKQKRIELGMSQDELAKKVGYKSRSSIQKIETARSLPLPKIEKMASALEVSPSYLMGWQEQFDNIQKQLEPVTLQLSMFGKQLSESLPYQIDINNGLKNEIDNLIQHYDASEILRAIGFVKAFLNAPAERQQIALEILQSHQVDS